MLKATMPRGILSSVEKIYIIDKGSPCQCVFPARQVGRDEPFFDITNLFFPNSNESCLTGGDVGFKLHDILEVYYEITFCN